MSRVNLSKNLKIIPNVRRLSSQTFPFMGMFDWEEGVIPLAQSRSDNAPTDAIYNKWKHPLLWGVSEKWDNPYTSFDHYQESSFYTAQLIHDMKAEALWTMIQLVPG